MAGYGNPYDMNHPTGADNQSPSLYSMLPPGWESGASVEELRRRQDNLKFLMEDSTNHEFGAPEEEYHEHYEEDEITPEHSQEIEEGEEEIQEEQGWIVPEQKEQIEEEEAEEVHEPVQTIAERTKSVSLEDESQNQSAQLMMTVGEYTKHGDGPIGSYVSYAINVKTTLSQYHKTEFVADRRYNDFFWLHDRLREHYKGIIIPPLPDKTIIQNRFDTQFIETRRRELGKFLKRLADHPVLCCSDIVQTFLESDPEELVMAKTKKPQAGVTKKMFSWMSSTVTLTSAQEIDPWFDTKKAYLLELELALDNLLKTSNMLLLKHKELVGMLYEFGRAAATVGQTEEKSDEVLSKHWNKFGDAFEQIRLLNQESIATQEIRFEEILHDYLRILASAKDAMSNRSNCLAEFQQAEKICIGKKDRKEKMAGTPKAAAADSEYEEAEKKLESAKEEYEMITETLRKELERFEKTKGKEITKVMREFAKENMDTTVQVADQWKKMLNQIQTYSGDENDL